jgi:AcrR family transcriptional regulator
MTQYHHGDLRAAILAAARRSLEAESDGDLSLRALAQAVGVSPNAPYRHFPTKESLLGALAARGFGELTARFAPYETAASPARMEGCVGAYLHFARENPGLYRLMFGRRLDALANETELGGPAQACFTALMAVVAQILARPMNDPCVRESAAITWSVCHGAALLDIDQATQFLTEAERPTAPKLTKVILSGLAG